MTDPATTPGPAAEPKIDTSVPHSARIWNYWLAGKDNYPIDQEAGDAYTAVFPGIVTIARSSRAFLRRNITHLVTERASGSSWTSEPACRPPTTPMRSRSASPPRPGSSTSTTTRWC
jgi:hypothetical protein